MSTTAATGSPFLLANRSTANAPCTGALTEIFNQSVSTDWLFTGVKALCVTTGAGSTGCAMSFNITSAFPSAVASEYADVGGASGIVVDNTIDASTTKITTDVYFIEGMQSCPDCLGRHESNLRYVGYRRNVTSSKSSMEKEVFPCHGIDQ